MNTLKAAIEALKTLTELSQANARHVGQIEEKLKKRDHRDVTTEHINDRKK